MTPWYGVIRGSKGASPLAVGDIQVAKRMKMSRGASRRSFTRGAVKTHRRNIGNPMRGGIRL